MMSLFVLTLHPSTSRSLEALKRFSHDQVSFQLVEDSTGLVVQCKHRLLEHVPWWRVTCADREYTVDLWLETYSLTSATKYSLMYHASEGVQSSGERLVQFQTHFTSVTLSKDTELFELDSSLDVRNGLASLRAMASFR